MDILIGSRLEGARKATGAIIDARRVFTAAAVVLANATSNIVMPRGVGKRSRCVELGWVSSASGQSTAHASARALPDFHMRAL